jgi:hypothetical protein
VLRERVDELRLRVLLRAGFFAAPLVVLFVRDAGAFTVLARVDRDVDDFARVAVDLFAVLRLAFTVDLRAPLRGALVDEPESPSVVHLPDITRCAASATASAINVPSLVALAITLLAA